MQFSGFDKKFRHDVIKSVLAAYEVVKEKEEGGKCPLWRPKSWKRQEERKETP